MANSKIEGVAFPNGDNGDVDSRRRANMARVGSKDTKPEIIVRRILHANGKRYRLHASELPGCPDVVFRRSRKAIFVHGCFWHRHEGCRRASTPKTRETFWRRKFAKNRERDERNQKTLVQMGWSYLIVWECELGDTEALRFRLLSFLNGNERKF